MSWTEERVELLKKLWAEGLSASQIAGRMGGITRNAVIGKVHRLGLSGRATPSRSPRPRSRKTRQPSHPSKSAHFQSTGSAALKADPQSAPEAQVEPEPRPIREVEIPAGQRATILTLNEHTCRWPIGDPGAEDFYFCGRNPKPGQPYCDFHCRIAFQPIQDRRRQRRVAGAGRSSA